MSTPQKPASSLGPLGWVALALIFSVIVLLAALLGVPVVHGQGVARAGVDVPIWRVGMAGRAGRVPRIVQGPTPELPRRLLDTTYAAPAALILVPAGANLQTAINTAPVGSTLVLTAGATYAPITLPNKSGSGWIYLISSQLASLAVGNRVGAGQASALPKILTAGTTPAISTASGAHHYRFSGIEIATTYGSTAETTYSIVSLDGGLPHDLVFDRCYIHGNTAGNSRRGILMNSASTAVIDSTISELHEVNQDSQAIIGWSGPGPFKVVNNTLTAAGENLQFGGADPGTNGLVPSDIEVRGNYITKPLSLKGSKWQVKNLLEIKNGQRILLEGNRFENAWLAAQVGDAILLTVRNQDGGCPWCIVQDVTVRKNWVLHVAEGIRISGTDNDFPSQRTTRVLMQDNVFDDVTASLGNGWAFCITGQSFGAAPTVGPDHVTFDHNTLISNDAIAITDTGGAQKVIPHFVFTNNIVVQTSSGFNGGGTGNGAPTLNGLYLAPIWTGNGVVGSSAGIYTGYPGNYFPASLSAVGFTNLAAHNYLLLSTSSLFHAGTDGTDIGAAIPAFNAAILCAGTGVCAGTPPPPPPPTPDTTAPVVSFATPAAGASLLVNTPVTITVTATDAIGVVSQTLTANGSPITTPHTFLTAGSVTLVATATDAAGNVGSASRSLTITPTPPPPTPVNCVVEWRVTISSGTTAKVTRVTITPASGGGLPCPTTATLVIK